MVNTRQSLIESKLPRRLAFTLVELLVVIAIIGILVALLLRAIASNCMRLGKQGWLPDCLVRLDM